MTKVPYKNYFKILADLNVVTTSPISLTMFYKLNGISISPIEDLETELPNSIKIHGNKEAVDAITCLVNGYLSI